MKPVVPRLARWLLTQRTPDEWRDFVVGDLEEEFQRRRAVSLSAARRWLWWQTLRCVAMPLRVRGRARVSDSTSGGGDSIMRMLLSDFRYAVRVLRRTPSFTAAVATVLAIGIGANTAVFSILNAVLLRPMPFEESDRIVRLFHVPPQETFPGIPRFPLSPANFYDWKRDVRTFESMALYRGRDFILTGRGNARTVQAGAVGADFFEIVRGAPALGRVFRADEDAPGTRVVILSDGFRKSHFGADVDVIDRTLTLNNEVYTIIGVMPASFSVTSFGVTARDIWVPLGLTETERAVRENHNQQAVARLRPGVDLAQAQSELDVISTRLEREFPQANAGWGATVVPLQEVIVGDVRMTLVMLLAAVALVLLIACANVGNLLFTRALGRQKEIAIRSALGAGRGRVLQQLLIEALVLAAVGGVAGLLLAHASLTAGATLLAGQVPRAGEISIDTRVLLFALGSSVLTGMLAGVMPAVRAGRADLTDALKEGGRNDGAVGIRTRRLLIICEVGLSVVLLMGAGLMLRSLLALRNVDAGFNPNNVLTMTVSLPTARYSTPAQRTAFFDTALERIRALPGVIAAGAIDSLPLLGGSVQPIVLEGQPELLPRDQPTVQVRVILPGYFESMNIPILRGRDVAASDVQVLLVSRSAAKLLWGDSDPIGRRVTLPLISRTLARQVIGIAADVKQQGLADAPAPTVYFYTQERLLASLTLVIHTAVPPSSLGQPAASVIRALDPEQPVEDIRTMVEVRDELLTSQRFSVLLLWLFASVALVLASVGIYSVLSYVIRGRRREIGIRSALGAQTTDVLRLVVMEGMTPALIGIAAGTLAALALSRFLERLMFEVSPSDPLTLAVVAATLIIVALTASLVPAYRASRLDPLTVLRDQ